jgi:hypothetical protein
MREDKMGLLINIDKSAKKQVEHLIKPNYVSHNQLVNWFYKYISRENKLPDFIIENIEKR